MRRPQGLLILAGLILVPAVQALPLMGQLRSEAPFELVGALTFGPDGVREGAFLRFDESPSGSTQIMDADQAELVIQTWVHDLLDDVVHVNAEGEPDDVEVLPVQDARLWLNALVGPAQVALARAVAPPAMAPEAAGAQCAIAPADSERGPTFPDDPRSLAPSYRYVPYRAHLEAACDAARVTVPDPGFATLYGLDLYLDSKDEDRSIRTGTYEEPDATGVGTQLVTRILRVNHQGAPLRFDFPLRTDVRAYSTHFLATGDLAVGPAQGNLIWDDVVQQGDVEPFRATGAFSIRSAAKPDIGLEGETLNGPVAAVSKGSTAAWEVVLAPVSLAGLGIAIVLAWAAWVLFGKIPADKLLDHPRRRLVLDYVRMHPGAPAHRVAQDLHISRAIMLHHVVQLRRGALVTVHRVGGRTALFPANAGYRGREEFVALLQRPTLRRLHGVLQRRPGLDQTQLASLLDWSQQRVSQSLARLTRAGMVRFDQASGRRLYFAVAPDQPPTSLTTKLS